MQNSGSGLSAGAADSKRQISLVTWERKLSQVQISKADSDKLVMNYLVVEGYKEAAEMFSKETGIQPSVDLSSIEDRMKIRSAIQDGNITEAIKLVNNLNPEILDTNAQLFFHLQQQKLIELIRRGKIADAIRFAQEELAALGDENPELLLELERTMALFAFDDPVESPVADLLGPLQRQKTASEVNVAVLASQNQEQDPKLPSLIKMVSWAQSQLLEKLSFPVIADFNSGELVLTPSQPSVAPSTVQR